VSNTLRALFALAAVATVAGCATPKQYGGLIPVDGAGFAERLDTLCELTSEAPSKECASYEAARNLEAR
jgi:hypothetical protein